MEYKAYVNGSVVVGWSRLSNGVSADTLMTAVPKSAPGASNNDPIILQPGETRIFSVLPGTLPSSGGDRELDLYPGYIPAGTGSGYEFNLNGLTGLSGSSNVELAMRLSDSRTEHSGQYQMYWTMTAVASQRYTELAANPVKDASPIYLAEDVSGKRIPINSSSAIPFANFQYVLKSGENLQNPGITNDYRCRNFIHANPVNQRSMYGEATDRMLGMSQYQVHIQSGGGSALHPDFRSTNNRAYMGSGILSSSGQTSVVTNEIPLVPVTSLASLMHFKLNPGVTDGSSGRHLFEVAANQALAIGNSFAHPLISGGSVYQDVQDAACRGSALQMQRIRNFHDHGFLNNDALWDDWFCSGITREDQGLFQTGRSLPTVVSELIGGLAPSKNPQLIPWKTTANPVPLLTTANVPSNNAHEILGRYVMIEGAFNINSTSVDAWAAFLGGAQDQEIISISPNTGGLISTAAPTNTVAYSRFSLPASPFEGANASDPNSWLGVRHLTQAQITRLAEECVKQVKQRGPFLNLSDFVNRRLANDQSGVCGALQAAIDWDEFGGNAPSVSPVSINGRFKAGDDFINATKVTGWNLNFPAAAVGSRYAGIPGYLTQADVLKRVGNQITPRDDTFRVRGYGEARDSSGNIQAKSWCEAVVRRVPDYMDSADQPETAFSALGSDINRLFGRRLKIVSFRWLAANEI